MSPTKKEAARERIINVSEKLFSQKGFDATRVEEIAEAAQVNKALIYYYFKSKEAILDHLLDTLFQDIKRMCLNFIEDHIIEMINDGRLDIEPDRFRFSSQEALELFKDRIMNCYKETIDYVLKRKLRFKILNMESLKQGKHNNYMFLYLKNLEKSNTNPVYARIHNADKDYDYPDEMIFFKFFFSFIPIVNFASYYEEYKAFFTLDDCVLKDYFIKTLQMIFSSLVMGTSIIIGEK